MLKLWHVLSHDGLFLLFCFKSNTLVILIKVSCYLFEFADGLCLVIYDFGFDF